MSPDLLFIDDDPLFLDHCRDVFAGASYTIQYCVSVQEGLNSVEAGCCPCLILIGQDVLELEFLYEIGKRCPKAQFILVAETFDPAILVQAVNSSRLFRCYLKNVEPERFRQGVTDAVACSMHRDKTGDLSGQLESAHLELEDLTFHMQKTVEYHLDKLQKSHDENIQLSRTLKRTVQELEGRDRVLRHLLTIHNLQDSLQTILEVIHDVVVMDLGIIYVRADGGEFRAGGVWPPRNEPAPDPSPCTLDAFMSGRVEQDSTCQNGGITVAVPVCRGDEVLGVIEVCWGREKHLSEDEILENSQLIYTFTIHAAMAILDHNVSRDKSSWGKTLDDVLLEFME